MRAIAVDDEKLGLSRITRLLNQSEYLSHVKGYNDSKEAIENFELDNADIAFLDIEMPEMSGLILAEILMQKNPRIEVVFVTAYDKYAVQAFEINAIGYVLKPVELIKIDKIIEKILIRQNKYKQIEKPKVLYVQVFQNYLVSFDEEKNNLVKFRTEKAKELLGYLLSYNGRPVSKDKIVDALWPDMDIDRANKNFHTTCYYIRKNLGIDNLILRNQNSYSINMEYVRSDINVFFLAIDELNKGNPQIETIKDAFFKYTGFCFGNEDYLWSIELQSYYEGYFGKMGIFLSKYYETKEWFDLQENILKHMLFLNVSVEMTSLKLIELNIKNGDISGATKIYNMYKMNNQDVINKKIILKMKTLISENQ